MVGLITTQAPTTDISRHFGFILMNELVQQQEIFLYCASPPLHLKAFVSSQTSLADIQTTALPNTSRVYLLFKLRLCDLWPACVDFRRAFFMSSSVLLLSLISSCWVFTSRSFCRSARALRACVWCANAETVSHSALILRFTVLTSNTRVVTAFSCRLPTSALWSRFSSFNLFLIHIIESFRLFCPRSRCESVYKVNTVTPQEAKTKRKRVNENSQLTVS